MFGYLTLATALIISVSSAVYSILGLTAIFAAAFWPIVVLGGSLEFGKIVTTLWLHKYWKQAEIQYKVYLCSAVAILMLLTSMGVFGFLSKAHLDQAVPSGDIQAQVQIFDDKIKTQQDNIKAARAALTQMDSAVDQIMSRSNDEKGADKAVAIRRSQARERTVLQNDIVQAQKIITQLQEQRAPVASQARIIEAEVGPIKYIAALVYGDNPDANLLEKAVRWVIILIVIVFDPLALTLLLAATKTFEWERNARLAPTRKESDYESDNDSLPDPEAQEFFDRAKHIAQQLDTDTYEPPAEQSVPNTTTKFRVLSGINSMWNKSNNTQIKDSEADHAPIEITTPTVDPIDNLAYDIDDIENTAESPDNESEDRRLELICERTWKDQNPNKTLKRERQLFRAGIIHELPWNNSEFRSKVLAHAGIVRGFGTSFPNSPVKGDMFLRVDRLPTALYKFNGNNWIEVDKAMTDQHAYNDAYIDHLIEKISTGEYDPELLSDAERDCIEQKLKSNPFKV